jgi:hypothetical protein
MKTIRMAMAVLVLGGLTACASETPQETTAPYRTLCQMAQVDFKASTGFTNTQVTFTIGSKNPEVRISDISMFIDAKSGRIPLAISSNGVMALPVSEELMKENPPVVVNQPKGSLTMEVKVTVSGAPSGAAIRTKDGLLRYSVLFAAENVKRQLARDLTGLQEKHDVVGTLSRPIAVHLRAENVESTEVVIRTREGDRPIKPVDPGHFIISFDAKLMEEDPGVWLSPRNKWSMSIQMEGTAEHPPAN